LEYDLILIGAQKITEVKKEDIHYGNNRFWGVPKKRSSHGRISPGESPQGSQNETIAVIGYGVQGPGQALNLKDNGLMLSSDNPKQFRKTGKRAVAMVGNRESIYLKSKRP